jgi:hypothetical protein
MPPQSPGGSGVQQPAGAPDITVSQSELYFPITLPPDTARIENVIVVTNRSPHPVLWKVKASSVTRYWVKPNAGVLAPGEDKRIIVAFLATAEDIPDPSEGGLGAITGDRFVILARFFEANDDRRDPNMAWKNPAGEALPKTRVHLPARFSDDRPKSIVQNVSQEPSSAAGSFAGSSSAAAAGAAGRARGGGTPLVPGVRSVSPRTPASPHNVGGPPAVMNTGPRQASMSPGFSGRSASGQPPLSGGGTHHHHASVTPTSKSGLGGDGSAATPSVGTSRHGPSEMPSLRISDTTQDADKSLASARGMPGSARSGLNPYSTHPPGVPPSGPATALQKLATPGSSAYGPVASALAPTPAAPVKLTKLQKLLTASVPFWIFVPVVVASFLIGLGNVEL